MRNVEWICDDCFVDTDVDETRGHPIMSLSSSIELYSNIANLDASCLTRMSGSKCPKGIMRYEHFLLAQGETPPMYVRLQAPPMTCRRCMTMIAVRRVWFEDLTQS